MEDVLTSIELAHVEVVENIDEVEGINGDDKNSDAKCRPLEMDDNNTATSIELEDVEEVENIDKVEGINGDDKSSDAKCWPLEMDKNNTALSTTTAQSLILDDGPDDDHTNTNTTGEKLEDIYDDPLADMEFTEDDYPSSDESYSDYIESEFLGVQRNISTSHHSAHGKLNGHRSFFADSPYFNTFVDKEMRSVEISSEAFADIHSKFQALAKAGFLFVKAARRLSIACKLETTSNSSENSKDAIEEKRSALGPKVTKTLEDIGMLMEKIADTQETFYKKMESNPMIQNLKASTDEMRMIVQLKNELKHYSKTSEIMYSEYLNGKDAQAGNFNNIQLSSKSAEYSKSCDIDAGNSSLTSLGSRESSPAGTTSISLWGMSSKIMDDDGLDPLEFTDERKTSFSSSITFDFPFRNQSIERNDEGPIKKSAIILAKRKKSIQNIRVEQTLAELKRFQFFKNLVRASFQRMFNLSKSAAEYVTMMQLNTDLCSKIIKKQIPNLKEHEEMCEGLYVEYKNKDQPIWLQRERSIVLKLASMEEAVIEAEEEVRKILKMDPCHIDLGTLSMEKAEEKTGIWDLPAELVACTHYLRETPPGVQVEGWLNRYEETTNMLKLSHSAWRRRWFILKNGVIFCLFSHSSNENEKTSATVDSIYKVKVCDVVLCTVREVPDQPSQARFRFELIVTNQKPVILQARGPRELRRWVDGIRSAVEKELVRGNPHSSELNQNIGKNKRSSEMGLTLKRGLSIFQASSNCAKPLLDAVSEEDYSESSFDHSNDETDDSDNNSSNSNDKNKRQLIKKVMQANPFCADCEKAHPEWVSLNLGVLVCLECSGVHRSLGVHVSQVRSLTLDSLSDIEASVIMALGNERLNKIYERRIPSSKKESKLHCMSNRKDREKWIKSKYIRKEFMGLARVKDNEAKVERKEKISRLLFKATKKVDVLGVAQFLAHGADINWINEAKGDRTALLACVEQLEKYDNKNNDEIDNSIKSLSNDNDKYKAALICAKLLVQNGAKTDALHGELRELLEIH